MIAGANKCKCGVSRKVAALGGKLTLDAFVSRIYLPYARNRKRSWAVDERIARRHLSPIFGSRRLEEITTFDVERWLSDLRSSGLAPSTCNRILATLKGIFSLAEIYGHIAFGASPCRHVRQMKVLPRRERFLNGEEGRRLMRELAQSERQEAKVIQLLLLTGARKSEILKARWEELDCERGILTVPLSKSGKPRYIFLSREAVRIFEGIERTEMCEWIFPGRKAQKPVSDIYQFWNSIRCKLGMRDVRLHDLRHSYASYLVGAGHTLYETQQLLGHSDPRTTMRYAHFAQYALVRAAGSVGRLLMEPQKSKDGKAMRRLVRKRNKAGGGRVGKRMRAWR